MKLSTSLKYGMRLLIDLGEHKNDGLVTLASIAERQNISIRYLEQVAVTLRRAGFIRSVKGSQGGYALLRDPCDIIIGDAMRAIEGDMLVVDPPASSETKLERTIRRIVFEPLNKCIAEIIDKENLAGLAGTKDSGDSYMYFI
jgi:Rrf2 family protein